MAALVWPRRSETVFTDSPCLVDTEEEFPPSPRIAEYVAGLLARWVDLTEDEEDTSPWSTGPLIGEASGPFVYFPMRYSMAEEASAYAADLAASMGLFATTRRLGCCDRDRLRTEGGCSPARPSCARVA